MKQKTYQIVLDGIVITVTKKRIKKAPRLLEICAFSQKSRAWSEFES